MVERMSFSDAAYPPLGTRVVAARRFDWAALLLWLAAGAAVLTGVGLALLWLVRNPLITGWDYLAHVNATLADAALVRAHDWGAVRDQFFLFERFQPPGLRLLGLPVALAFPHAALTALRLSATVCFVLTAALLFAGLRRIAGAAGAAASVLAYALAPVNITGAQNFMTEQILLPCAAVVIGVLAAELGSPARRPGGAQVVRLVVLGLALGWGTLTKLTFLPTFGILWLGTALLLWRRERDGAALLLRLVLPAALLLLVAWPAYALNGPRYLAYARATANGFAFQIWPERGLAFAVRVVATLIGDVFGPAGIIVLAAGLVLLVLCWRGLSSEARGFAALCVLAGLPTLAAYCFSRNQTDRYMMLDTLLFAVPVAIGYGAAVRASLPAARAAVAVAAVAAAAELALAWAIAAGAPLHGQLLSGLVYASVRSNYACDYRVMARLTPPVEGPVRIGVYGESQAVNPNDLTYGYREAGVPAWVVQFSNSSSSAIDWDTILREAAQVDYVVMPEQVDGWYATLATNRTRAEFPPHLATVAQVTPMGVVATGNQPQCRAVLYAVRPLPGAPAPRRPPLLPDTFIPGWTAGM
jgi:hypothetical protein